MFRKFAALVVCFVILTVTSSLFAEDVYITKQGKKYHQSDCRFIKNRDTEKIDIEDAKAKNLEPCGRCFGQDQTVSKDETQLDENKDLVYITENGKKYHKTGCSLVKNKNTTGVSISAAKAKGLEPCGKCILKQQAKAE